MYTNAQTASGVQSGIWTTDITYDNNGNMLSSSKYCGNTESNQKSYTYDTWGRLTGFSDSLGSTASYGYYSDGLRASKTIGSNTTKYYYDGDHVINETLNGSNYATNVLGVNGYISRRQNGTTGYLFKDAHGDVLAAYSSTTSKIADYSYDAWGSAMSENETSSFTNNPLRYCGEYYDTESGMTYLRARYYDSEIKRFITEDPAKDGLNWYAYAGNNPVMKIDPTGEYDRNVAVMYAYTYAYSENEKYGRYDSWVSFITSFGSNRGDCANFVSQCLVAGGISQKPTWHFKGYDDDDSATASWMQAKAQFEYFLDKERGYTDKEILQIWSMEGLEYNVNNNIQKGDLMYFADRNSCEVHHAVIITEVTENEIYFAGHTNDHDHEELSKYLSDNMVFVIRVRDEAVNGYLDD